MDHPLTSLRAENIALYRGRGHRHNTMHREVARHGTKWVFASEDGVCLPTVKGTGLLLVGVRVLGDREHWAAIWVRESRPEPDS